MTPLPLTAPQVTAIHVFVALVALGLLMDLCLDLLLPGSDEDRR